MAPPYCSEHNFARTIKTLATHLQDFAFWLASLLGNLVEVKSAIAYLVPNRSSLENDIGIYFSKGRSALAENRRISMLKNGVGVEVIKTCKKVL